MKKLLIALGAGLLLSCTAQAGPQVEIKTSLGPLVLELEADKAPITVENFLQYVKDGFYNGTTFHRVIDGFMVQGGGFLPGMKEKPTRKPIRNEARNGLKNAAGTIAMARTNNPDSATAQFFINLVDNPMLDYPNPDGAGYAVFGRLVQGQETLQKIARVRTGNVGFFQNVPLTPVVIESVKLLPEQK